MNKCKSARARVLLVEDDRSDEELTRQDLSRGGHFAFEVETAGNLDLALDRLHSSTFDVVLLDLGLPTCCGLEALSAIRAVDCQIPIVVLTGLSDEQTALDAIEQGAQDYVVKGSLSPDTLGRSVRYAIQRRESEKALEDRDEQLRQSQKLEAIGALAGGIAHEFNNFLQAISGYTKFAIDGLSADEQRFRDLQMVLNVADQAATLTKQLLTFGRRQVLYRTEIDPNKVVAEAAKLLRPLIGAHIEVDTQYDPAPKMVSADAGQLQQALLNLCINARDAMPDGGRLLIRIQNFALDESVCEGHPHARPGAHVLLTVADSGCGMTADVKEHIFEPFFTTKEQGRGTGLGLAMVYGMVEQHGGMIHVHSEPGSGTTFRIYLPVSDENTTQQPAPAAPPASRGSETILIAEHDPLVREFVVRVLERAGYKTLTAVDGVDGLRTFHENAETIALSLLDVVMPQMGGRALCQQIRAICPATRVIFCTGHDPEINQAETGELGASPLLQKPVDPVELLQTIRSELDKPARCLQQAVAARTVGKFDQASGCGCIAPLAGPGLLTDGGCSLNVECRNA